MDVEAFRASLAEPSPPADLNLALRALWFDARGNWDGAHDAAQADEGAAGDWVHAYLHRKEGDSRQRRLLVSPRATSRFAKLRSTKNGRRSLRRCSREKARFRTCCVRSNHLRHRERTRSDSG